jgi:hypothetical protein
VVHRGYIPNENEKTTVLPVVCFVEKCPRKGSHVTTNRLFTKNLHGPAHGTKNHRQFLHRPKNCVGWLTYPTSK